MRRQPSMAMRTPTTWPGQRWRWVAARSPIIVEGFHDRVSLLGQASGVEMTIGRPCPRIIADTGVSKSHFLHFHQLHLALVEDGAATHHVLKVVFFSTGSTRMAALAWNPLARRSSRVKVLPSMKDHSHPAPSAVAQGEGDHPGPDPFQDLDLALIGIPPSVAEVPDALAVAGRDHLDLVPVFHTEPLGVRRRFRRNSRDIPPGASSCRRCGSWSG